MFDFQSKVFEFNRGFLFNVGFKEAIKDSGYECFILHDVDLLPENDYNTYACMLPTIPNISPLPLTNGNTSNIISLNKTLILYTYI